MPRRRWTLQLSVDARRDFVSILIWTAESFGNRQAERYQATLLSALNRLKGGPAILGVKTLDVGGEVRSLRVAHGRRKGRHIVIFRLAAHDTIEVIRILHDSMDLARHLPPET